MIKILSMKMRFKYYRKSLGIIILYFSFSIDYLVS